MSSNKNSQTRGTPLVCFQKGKILKLKALPFFTLKWKEFINQKHSLCLFSVNTLNSSSTVMHILWLPLRIQSHNAQSKKLRLFTWIEWHWSFPIKENDLAIKSHDRPKDLFEGNTFCSFEKEKKNDFSQNWQKYHIAKKGFYTTKF